MKALASVTEVHRPAHRLRLALGITLGAALLALVFWLYAEPSFVVMLADQIWACF